jgi:hypothetical protein
MLIVGEIRGVPVEVVEFGYKEAIAIALVDVQRLEEDRLPAVYCQALKVFFEQGIQFGITYRVLIVDEVLTYEGDREHAQPQIIDSRYEGHPITR